MMEENVYKNVIIFGRWHFFYCISTNFRINCSTKYTAQARQFTTSYRIHPNADKKTANFELFFLNGMSHVAIPTDFSAVSCFLVFYGVFFGGFLLLRHDFLSCEYFIELNIFH